MNNKKKKLLIVIQFIRRGGVELVALNFARNLNRDKYDISILLVAPDEHQENDLLKEVQESGIKTISVPNEIKGYKNRYNYIYNLIKTENYDIVHSHVMFFSGLVMLAAKKCGVRVRACHSHATKWNRKENLKFKLYKKAMRFLINTNATDLFACSNQAGIYLYGEKAYRKKGLFIANGIDTHKYIIDDFERNKKREEFGLTDSDILVGHIGTIYYIKNQIFLVEVFAKMLKKNANMKLILVGEKADIEPVKEKIFSLGLENKVILTGRRTDIPQLLSAMDIMIFPSLFEALPVSLIEAQASKLPCLISDTVTLEVKFNDNVEFMSLNESSQKWADKAFELLDFDRKSVSTDKLVKNYDISYVIETLDSIYGI